MIRTQPPPLPQRDAQARQERIDLFLLLGQCVATLVLGAWAGEAAAAHIAGAAWIGSGILIAALACGYAAARVLVFTVLAPWAVLQLIQRARDPRGQQPATRAGERRAALLLNTVGIVVFIGMALLGGCGVWAFGRNVELFGALWRFGLAAMLLSLPMPRAMRALG